MQVERERVALVTGAAGGVGRAVVELLTTRGYAVVATDISPAVAELAADTVVPLVGDVADSGSAERAVATAHGSFGRVSSSWPSGPRLAGRPRRRLPQDRRATLVSAPIAPTTSASRCSSS